MLLWLTQFIYTNVLIIFLTFQNFRFVRVHFLHCANDHIFGVVGFLLRSTIPISSCQGPAGCTFQFDCNHSYTGLQSILILFNFI